MSGNISEIIMPSEEEDAEITASIADDPDDFELDEEWFAQAKPTAEVLPNMLNGKSGGALVTLDLDIIKHFQSQGPDWLVQINRALRKHMETEKKG